MERKQFTFYKSFKEMLDQMSKTQRLELYDAITDYGIYGQLRSPISPRNQAIFNVIKPNLDSGAKKAQNALNASAKRKQNNSKKEKEIECENELEKEVENELEYELETETENDCSKGVCSASFFDLFMKAYPTQIDLSGAMAAWQRLKPDHAMFDKIMKALDTWKDSPRWKNEDGRYIPNATAFLDKGYWRNLPISSAPAERKAPTCGAKGKLGEAELENLRQLMSYEPDTAKEDAV